MAEKFIKIQALYSVLALEPFILLASLLAMTWIFYKGFLAEVSDERHRNIRNHFRTLMRHFFFLSVCFALFILAQNMEEQLPLIHRLTPYIALISFVAGNIVLVKTCRLLVLQYLFLGSMKHGVPLLLVNMFSLLLSIVLGFWGIAYIFGVELAPLLATSAAFSIILGLAMQDTLGNLFAGISLQIDPSYEIGDWLEVVSGIQKAVGQVKEISWRATTLIGLSDEVITLPNRFMALAQVSNFSPPDQPIMRSQIFRLHFDANVEFAKEVLERMAAGVSEIRGIPAPYAYVNETNEHWVSLKLLYFIESYGSQFIIGDRILRRGMQALRENRIQLARQVMEVALKDSHDSAKP